MTRGWLSGAPQSPPKAEGLTGFLGRDMAVDLGTANTLVYVRGRGIVLNEPSVVAVNTTTSAILAVGAEAKRMIGRTPAHIRAIRPLRDGVIADFDITEKMLRYFIQKVHHRRLMAKPRIVVCIPSGITGVEQRAVEEATYAAGARAAFVIEEPMAAAIGAGLPIHEPSGNMVVDIGGGTAEAIKIAIGSAFPTADEMIAEIKGRDLISGLPKTINVTSEEIRKALEEPVNAIIDAVRNTLDRCPPELAADVLERGIVLTGGGALLKGMDERLKHETGMPIHVAENPLSCVAIGSGKCLEEFEVLKRVLISSNRG